MRMKKFILCLLIPLCVGLTGCGYTTGSNLASNIKTIHIKNFKNSIDYTAHSGRNVYLPLLEVDVTNAVSNRFLFDGHLKLAEEEEADLVLTGELISYRRDVLRYTDSDEVEEYRVNIVVRLSLYNADLDAVEWTEGGFYGEADYFVTGSEASSETDAIDEAMTDLARRVVERTIENW